MEKPAEPQDLLNLLAKEFRMRDAHIASFEHFVKGMTKERDDARAVALVYARALRKAKDVPECDLGVCSRLAIDQAIDTGLAVCPPWLEGCNPARSDGEED